MLAESGGFGQLRVFSRRDCPVVRRPASSSQRPLSRGVDHTAATQKKTFDAILAWLFKLAEQKPTRLIVEDMYWADPSTLELLGLLVDQVTHTRLFVALAFRTGFIPRWRVQSRVTNIALAPLLREASELMVLHVAGGQLPAALVREIVEKTEGVQLFLEELTRMVLKSGMLHRTDAGYELRSSPPLLPIPSTLSESLMARLDRLGMAKEVAQIASVIGKECSYDLLRAVSQFEETKLTGALNCLVDAELFDQLPTSSRNDYRFRHALICDTAYESLLKRNAASITAKLPRSCRSVSLRLRKRSLNL